MVDQSKPLTCSFCGLDNTNPRVRKMIAGPRVYICNECTELCHDILREEGTVPAVVDFSPIVLTDSEITKFEAEGVTADDLFKPTGIVVDKHTPLRELFTALSEGIRAQRRKRLN